MINGIHREPGDLTVFPETSYDTQKRIFYLKTSCMFNFATDTKVVIAWSNHALFDLAPKEARINCIPESLSRRSAEKSICFKRGCIWDDEYVAVNVPHIFDSNRANLPTFLHSFAHLDVTDIFHLSLFIWKGIHSIIVNKQ
uniref:P-type domain-containing protein n=1 Tax=Parascaris equorum TaxID=6256 RepID=A0A914RW72_PAREQ